MEGSEVRARRKALRMTLAQFGAELGVSGDFVGRVERGEAPITPRTEAAVRSVKPKPLGLRPAARDPLEREIEKALIEAGIRFTTDQGGANQARLDFYLPDFDVAIEVKRFYTARTGEQMARMPNVIAAQGETAVRFLAAAIRSGDFLQLVVPGKAAAAAS